LKILVNQDIITEIEFEGKNRMNVNCLYYMVERRENIYEKDYIFLINKNKYYKINFACKKVKN